MGKFKKAVISAIRATVKQGHQSLDATGSNCMLRGCNGDRCTIGFMVADEIYNKDLEDLTPDDGVLLYAVNKSLGITHVTPPNKEILKILQDAHDYPTMKSKHDDFTARYIEKMKFLVESEDLPSWTLEGLTNQKAQ